jgi:hypothetical protein
VVATPNLTLNITPPGGSTTNYAHYLAWYGNNQNITITQNFGRQGDTATFSLVDEYSTSPHFYIPVLSQIALIDNSISTTLFAGVVNDPILLPTGPNRNEWTLNCTDYTFYADNADVQGLFNDLGADEMVVLLTEQANCGITAKQIINGGFVASAPRLTQAQFSWGTLSSAWRSLAQLSGSSTPYGWYVDENLELHFYDASTAINSNVTFTTTPTVAGSTTQGHIALDSNFQYEWDGTTIHNKIIIQGANQTIYQPITGNPTDVWRADGTQTAWPLRYTATGDCTLTLNGRNTAVTFNSTGVASTDPWAIQQNAFGQWFLVALTPPNLGTTLKLWYDYQVPVIATAQDLNSQATYTGPNRGVYSEYINDSSLITVQMALARALRERTEYAYAVERTTFTVTEEFLGWVRAGYTFTYHNQFVPDSESSYSWGLTDTFLCTGNTISWGSTSNSPYRSMSVTGVRA